MTAPARVAVRLRAWDSKGQLEEGAWTAADVYSPVDVERSLAERRSAVRAELPALLLHGTGYRLRNQEVDVPLIYADYYFIEALLRHVACRGDAK